MGRLHPRGCVSWNNFFVTEKKEKSCRNLHGCVSWNRSVFIVWNNPEVATYMVAWVEIPGFRKGERNFERSQPTWLRELKSSAFANQHLHGRVATYMVAWVEINISFSLKIRPSVGRFLFPGLISLPFHFRSTEALKTRFRGGGGLKKE